MALNKIELLDPDDLLELRNQVQDHGGLPVHAISAAASQNLKGLLDAVWLQLGIPDL